MFATFRNIGRLTHIVCVMRRHDALLPLEYKEFYPPSLHFARIFLGRRISGVPFGERLAAALTALGPASIKLGQVLATRPDVVGDDAARALSGLQDRLKPFPTEQAKAVVAAALGHSLESQFSEFGEPVAAASIAQVHTAVTTQGQKVAVKVLRPGIEAQFARDISAFAMVARLAEKSSAEARRLHPTAVVGTLATTTALELDLRIEAAAASELGERTKDDPLFRVPHVDWTRTAQRVLTLEWIDGTPVREPAALTAAGHDPKRVGVIVLQSFLKQALRDGFFHADMHPGNLFVDAQGRLVAVDFGIMGRLDPPMRRFMAETLAGFLARDYVRVAQVHYDVAFVPSHHPVETFAQALRAIGEPIFGRSARDVSMAKLLQQLFDTTRRFDMELQPQLVLLQKTMVVVEGVARSLDPDFDIWESSRPVAENWLVENVGPERTLRDAADGLSALSKAAQNLPHLIKNAEIVSDMLASGGLRLHPDTAAEIAEAQTRRTRHARVALWIGAIALAVLTVGLLT